MKADILSKFDTLLHDHGRSGGGKNQYALLRPPGARWTVDVDASGFYCEANEEGELLPFLPAGVGCLLHWKTPQMH